ncbi:DUF6623 family protein [Duganella aceris]|uniref:Gp5/Type VI secretion system Vgr protein OB-fold domain-containing protein n=1 Tax=Duganella aceris TaxID=2703883 RepID=A0ABX0FP60_9BURK|nr:DUF6623 family protein [Duganella aceris]NGZ86278.1 hypothetical protein [Duganella aceris]
MAEMFHFWTHGVNVVPEFTKELTGTNNGLVLRPMGYGTSIKQNRGTDNWFHLAIPSGTKLDGDAVRIRSAWLRLSAKGGPMVDRVRIHEATGPGAESKEFHDSGALNVSEGGTQLNFNLGSRPASGPLVMCIHAIFNGAGEIIISGAGAQFDEL